MNIDIRVVLTGNRNAAKVVYVIPTTLGFVGSG
jgi:hypothetical protein